MTKLSSQEGALAMRQDNVDLCTFLSACAAGDATARRQFQETYGEDIYNFPVKIYRTPIEETGDYYVYVFERDRIFTRLRTFEGRNGIQFCMFLSHYVLKHLFLEWRRTCKEIDTISLQTPIDEAEDGYRTLEDILPSAIDCDCTDSDQDVTSVTTTTLDALTREDRLHLKLLSLLDCHLSAEEVRLLARISRRTLDQTLMLLAEIYTNLRRKDEKIARLCDELDSVWGWIVLRQKELHAIQQQLSMLSSLENIVDTTQLITQKRTLENALAKRTRQRERLVEELRTYKLTTSYKDIARLLNTSVTSVYSRLSYLRERLAREFDINVSPEVDAA